MIVERDNYGPFHVRGTSEEGRGTWEIQVWLRGSDQDATEDHRFTVKNQIITPSPHDENETEAITALISQWEDRLPLMVASPI